MTQIKKYEDKLSCLNKKIEKSKHLLDEDSINIMYEMKFLLTEVLHDIKINKSTFTQGYTCACANLVRMTGDATGTIECELLGANISTLEGLKNDGVDESDIEVLKPTIAELERKRFIN